MVTRYLFRTQPFWNMRHKKLISVPTGDKVQAEQLLDFNHRQDPPTLTHSLLTIAHGSNRLSHLVSQSAAN